MRKEKKTESGMVIVEASIVFPVMFLVIFLLLFLGNAYYQKSCIERLVTQTALEAAAEAGDPLLAGVKEGSFPSVDSVDVKPYRYIFPGACRDVASSAENKLKKRLKTVGTGFFTGMTPKGIEKTTVTFDWGVFCSTMKVQVDCKIPLGIRLLGEKSMIEMPVTARASAPVSDAPEFVRIVDTVGDYMNKLGVTEAISKVTEKIKGWFS